MGNESYVQREEEQQDANGFGVPFGMGGPNPAKPMIEMSDTNRILISDKQAQLLNLIGMHCAVLNIHSRDAKALKPLLAVIMGNHQDIQSAQLTRDSYSREDYIKIAAPVNKKKGLFSNPFSHKQTASNDSDQGDGSD